MGGSEQLVALSQQALMATRFSSFPGKKRLSLLGATVNTVKHGELEVPVVITSPAPLQHVAI